VSDANFGRRLAETAYNSVSLKLKLIWPIFRISNEPGSNRILSDVIPLLGREFIGSKQSVEAASLPVPNHPEILGFSIAVRVVEPAFEPFREGTNRSIAITWCR
jgi:hypothetical protein